MQFVERSLFLSLAGLNESETAAVDYMTLVEEALAAGYDGLIEWAGSRKDCLKLAGIGSSRFVVTLENGMCLKFSRYPEAAVQQRAEIRNCLKARKLRLNCFPELVDYDGDGKWLATWACTQAEYGDFKRIYGYSLPVLMTAVTVLSIAARRTGGLKRSFAAAVQMIENRGYDADDEIDDVFGMFDYYADIRSKYSTDSVVQNSDGTVSFDGGGSDDPYGQAIEAILQIEKCGSDEWKQLRQLVRFGSTSHDSTVMTHDLWTPGNWGLALVNGRQLPMVVDSGYCPELEGGI